MSAPKVQRVAVAGAGGMGREALAWLRDARPDVYPVAFFVADLTERPSGADVDLSVLADVDALVELEVTAVVLGIGDNALRETVAAELAAAGISLLPVVHPTAFLGPGVEVAPGAIIAPGCVLTRDIMIGRGVIVNYGAAVGHDGIVEDFAFIGPAAVLAGGVRIGADALVGAGAVILPGRTVGSSATVGAGAVVTCDVVPSSTVVGNPARTRPEGPSASEAADE